MSFLIGIATVLGILVVLPAVIYLAVAGRNSINLTATGGRGSSITAVMVAAIIAAIILFTGLIPGPVWYLMISAGLIAFVAGTILGSKWLILGGVLTWAIVIVIAIAPTSEDSGLQINTITSALVGKELPADGSISRPYKFAIDVKLSMHVNPGDTIHIVPPADFNHSVHDICTSVNFAGGFQDVHGTNLWSIKNARSSGGGGAYIEFRPRSRGPCP